MAIKDQEERQLKTFRDQGERQLVAIKNSTMTNKSHKIEFHSDKNQQAKKQVNEVYRVVKKNNKSLHVPIQMEHYMILMSLGT